MKNWCPTLGEKKGFGDVASFLAVDLEKSGE